MHATKKIVGSMLLGFLAIGLIALPQHASPNAMQLNPQEPVPAFHSEAPKDALPSTMDPHAFSDPLIMNAYAIAGRIKKVLYQQPCYCHCDRSQGHGSLLDCFVSRHGSGCNICMDEDFYAFEQTRKGKTPSQIRDAIMKGEWRNVDTSKYSTPLPQK